MVKFLISILVITAVAIFSVPQYASAAAIDSGDWGVTALDIVADTFGTGKPSTDQTFTPSSGVRMTFFVSADFNYYNIVAQHKGGDKQYGLHSNGGRMFWRAVSTSGTWDTTDAPAIPSAAEDAATNFTNWTAM